MHYVLCAPEVAGDSTPGYNVAERRGDMVLPSPGAECLIAS